MTDPAEELAAREAADWHARLQSRSVSNSDLDRFYEWRSDQRNARAFEAVDAVWNRASNAADDPGIMRAVQEIGKEKDRPFSIWQMLLNAKTIGAAALASIAIVVCGIYLLNRPTIYDTAVGETLVVLLDDGSRVTLNTDSRIAVRFSKGERRIELANGQALFQVAHDASRPLRVFAGDANVTALGTEFEVRRASDQVNVTLVNGRIAVAPGVGLKVTRLAAPGATMSMTGAVVRLAKSDTRVALSWTTGKIDLREQPLSVAIGEVNRYAREKIVLDDNTQASTRISGVFATGDRDAFTAAVTALLPLREFRATDGTIHLRSAARREAASGAELR